MKSSVLAELGRRERQIVDVLYRLGQASVQEIHDLLDDRPSYDAVRVTLTILERKGHVRHWREGRRYVYAPTVPVEVESRSAIRQAVRTFFRGSPSQAILAMIDESADRLTDDELAMIQKRIRDARRGR